MRRTFRNVYVALAWLFFVSILVQVFFAGMMMFGVDGGRSLHVTVGWSIHSANFLWLAVPALARAGRNTIILGLVLFAVVFVQPLLPGISESAPIVAALHPVIALVMFLLSFMLAQRSLVLLREERAVQPAT